MERGIERHELTVRGNRETPAPRLHLNLPGKDKSKISVLFQAQDPHQENSQKSEPARML